MRVSEHVCHSTCSNTYKKKGRNYSEAQAAFLVSRIKEEEANIAYIQPFNLGISKKILIAVADRGTSNNHQLTMTSWKSPDVPSDVAYRCCSQNNNNNYFCAVIMI